MAKTMKMRGKKNKKTAASAEMWGRVLCGKSELSLQKIFPQLSLHDALSFPLFFFPPQTKLENKNLNGEKREKREKEGGFFQRKALSEQLRGEMEREERVGMEGRRDDTQTARRDQEQFIRPRLRFFFLFFFSEEKKEKKCKTKDFPFFFFFEKKKNISRKFRHIRISFCICKMGEKSPSFFSPKASFEKKERERAEINCRNGWAGRKKTRERERERKRRREGEDFNLHKKTERKRETQRTVQEIQPFPEKKVKKVKKPKKKRASSCFSPIISFLFISLYLKEGREEEALLNQCQGKEEERRSLSCMAEN